MPKEREREGLNDVVNLRSNDFKTKSGISSIHPAHLLSVIWAPGEAWS